MVGIQLEGSAAVGGHHCSSTNRSQQLTPGGLLDLGCLTAVQDMSKDAVEKMRAAQEKAAQLTALAAAQPIRPVAPAENQGGPSLVAAAQAAANALAQKVTAALRLWLTPVCCGSNSCMQLPGVCISCPCSGLKASMQLSCSWRCRQILKPQYAMVHALSVASSFASCHVMLTAVRAGGHARYSPSAADAAAQGAKHVGAAGQLPARCQQAAL